MCAVIIEARRVNWIPGTQVLHDCELPCGCRELNLGLLQEQLMPLTAEPPLRTILRYCTTWSLEGGGSPWKYKEGLPVLCACISVTFQIGMWVGGYHSELKKQDWGQVFISISDALDRQ